MDIVVTELGNEVSVRTPYVKGWPDRAKQLGGRWDGKAWRFDSRDKSRVEELLGEFFGWVTEPSGETVTIRIPLAEAKCEYEQELHVAGRLVARRPSRDSRVQLGTGVVVVEGRFSGMGGSHKNPALGDVDDVVVELRDFPVEAIQRIEVPHQVVTEKTEQLVELRAERARLQARIAELDAAIAALEAAAAPEENTSEG